MKWIFFDINKSVTDAMTKHLSKHGEVFLGDFRKIKCDAIVSPANSFGFMDGGIDGAYTAAFGPQMQVNLQNAIKEDWGGELPVGCAEIVKTGYIPIPYLISAPTMRVPLDIRNTVNVYLAMMAVVGIVDEYADESIETIAVPGLGTGVGGMDPEVMALQMLAAFEGSPFPTRLGEAIRQHHTLLYGRDISNG